MKSSWSFVSCLAVILSLVPTFAEANSGDFNGGVAIGSSYAGAVTAPTNGMVVQGNVGIGTTAPSAPLDIKTGASNDLWFGADTTFPTYNAISFNGTFADPGILGVLGGGTGDPNLYILTPSTGGVHLRPGSGASILAASTGVTIGTAFQHVTPPINGLIIQGNVGIGTTTPLTPLDVQSSGNTELRVDEGTGTSIASLLLGQIAQNPATEGLRFLYDSNSGNSYIRNLYSAGNLYFDTAGNGLNINNNNTRMTILAGGTVGIGTLAPRGGSLLDINGKIYVASFATGTTTTVCQTGNVLATCSSAKKYKENIEPSDLGLKEVLAMKPVTFDFKDHEDNWEKHDFGFVAEDMEKINPLFVTYDDKNEISGVRYMQLTAVEAKAIQQLDSIVARQQNEIDAQKKEIDDLKKMVDELVRGKE